MAARKPFDFKNVKTKDGENMIECKKCEQQFRTLFLFMQHWNENHSEHSDAAAGGAAGGSNRQFFNAATTELKGLFDGVVNRVKENQKVKVLEKIFVAVLQLDEDVSTEHSSENTSRQISPSVMDSTSSPAPVPSRPESAQGSQRLFFPQETACRHDPSTGQDSTDESDEKQENGHAVRTGAIKKDNRYTKSPRNGKK